MKLLPLPGVLLLASVPCLSQSSTVPQLSGYITKTGSPQNFEVNGQQIKLSAKTDIEIRKPSSSPHTRNSYAPLPLSDLHPYLGEPADVYGSGDKDQRSIQADRVELGIRTPHHVSGSGIVDAVLPSLPISSAATDHLIRADGYLILISSATQSTLKKPLASTSGIQVNGWITFDGLQREDGIVVADKVVFTTNVISPDDLRRQTDCDPPAIPADKPRDPNADFPCEIDLTQIASSPDSTMQAHLSAIGARLVPKYQQALPSADTTRINFRFLLIADNKVTTKWNDALALPDGIILMPHALVERLQNDSQIAAVLATSIAALLEKQPLTIRLRKEKSNGRLEAEDAALETGLGLAGPAIFAGEVVKLHHFHQALDQSGRVSLWLLHDAGYDINQAPIAWWLLATKKPQDIAAIPLPRRSASLYEFLGDSWPKQDFLTAPPDNPIASSTPQPTAPAAQQ